MITILSTERTPSPVFPNSPSVKVVSVNEKDGQQKPTAPNERGKNEVLIKNFKRFCQHREPSPVLF